MIRNRLLQVDHYYMNNYEKMIGVYFGATPLTSLRLCTQLVQAKTEEKLGTDIDSNKLLFGFYKQKQDSLIEFAFSDTS